MTRNWDSKDNPVRSVAGKGKWILSIIIFLAVMFFFFIFATPHFYFFKQVKEDQIGIKIRSGQITHVLPPGVYHDVGWFVRLDTFTTQEYKFQASDPEVITRDQQRIGVVVSGSVFRPGLADEARLKILWTQYKSLYTNDEALKQKFDQLSMQAMKVCVGDRPFQDSVIGSDRDALRQCIDVELDKLAEPYGLLVTNVVVPNVNLSPEVQSKMDAITQSRLDTEKAAQDKLKADAEARAEQARKEGEIRVTMSQKQEEARQQATLAQLEQERLIAQLAVIGAQKENDLLAAQKELEIAEARALAAAAQARADLAQQLTLAQLYALHPEYVSIILAQTNANAIKSTDKLIFTPEGVFPNLVFSSGILPTFPLSPQGPEQPAPSTP
jgi:hypothetical protein